MGGTSEGDHQELKAAGDALRTMVNHMFRMANNDPIIAAGGLVEQKLSEGSGALDDAGFGDMVAQVGKGIYQQLLDGAYALADGSMAFYYWADWFYQADKTPDPTNPNAYDLAAIDPETHLPWDADPKTKRVVNGVTYVSMAYDPYGENASWMRDRNGHWVVTSAEHEFASDYGLTFGNKPKH